MIGIQFIQDQTILEREIENLRNGGPISSDVVDSKIEEIVERQRGNGTRRNEVRCVNTLEVQMLERFGRIPNYYTGQFLVIIGIKNRRFNVNVLRNRVLTTYVVEGEVEDTHREEIIRHFRVENDNVVEVRGRRGNNNCGPVCLCLLDYIVENGVLPPNIFGTTELGDLNVTPQEMRESLLEDAIRRRS